MTGTGNFETFLLALRATPIDQHTEMTGRGALETLLNAYKPARATVTHEPRRAQTKGAPDYKVHQVGQILGYVENKAVGENLDAVLKSAQIKKYQALSGNIVVTDYLRFIWLKDGKVNADARLGEAGLLSDRKAQLRPERVAEVEALLCAFFSQPVTGISRAKPLAEALATRSQLLRDYLGDELVRQQAASEGGQLIGLFGAFERQVSHEITLAEFADAFAQTLAYGLFLAKLNDGANEEITLANAKTFIPQSVGLIRELVGFLDNLDRAEYADIRWVVEEILSIINGLKLTELQEDLSFRGRKAKRGTRAGSDEEWRLFSRDPFIYFYEDYLAKYDAKLRKSRGVYYTPPPIVNFIVRAVHDILKDTFGIEAGLADRDRVTVLDFACGTGTFLVEVLERIFEEIGPDSGKASAIVSEHILKNIFGFEYLIAPYTIAHLKLGQYLAEKGHKLGDKERFQVYLTNTLEPIEPQRDPWVPELSKETEAAQRVKEKPILVITGNPPYSGHSRNPSTRLVPFDSLNEAQRKRGDYRRRTIKSETGTAVWAEFKTDSGKLIDNYKFVWETDADGRDHRKPLGEKNSKWLQDDYVKFFAFAEEKMRHVDEGVVGIITNHSFLDNPTFRGMRQSLMRTFDQIRVIDLHGNLKKKEVAPDGSKDENVFDIEQGVAISLLIKKPGLERGVWREDVWGKRQEKYDWGAATVSKTLAWNSLQPAAPLALFLPRDNQAEALYREFWSLPDLMPVNGTGMVSKRDKIAYQYSKQDIEKVVTDIIDLDLADIVARYPAKSWKSRDGKVEFVKRSVTRAGNDPARFIKVTYQPFDTRWAFYTEDSRGLIAWPVVNIMSHMRLPNVGLMTNRSQEIPGMWTNILATSRPGAHHALSSKEVNYFLPLYLFPPSEGARTPKAQTDMFGQADPFAGKERIENIAPKFRRWLDDRLGGEPASPEAILGYIYAVLHAPTYRARYANFLRSGFPRIPFPEDRAGFETLSRLGWALVEAHLMKAVPKRGMGGYRGKGGDKVEGKPVYSPVERKLKINDTNHFVDVPQAVWEFTIGGYQVIDKYLKSRKGRTLSLDEIENVENVVNNLDFTIEQMAAIDTAYLAAFGDQ